MPKTWSLWSMQMPPTAPVTQRFGKQPNGYNTFVKVPRVRDARGHILIEGYRIYPITLPEPEERPEGRQLTVVADPCTGKIARVFEPAG